MIIESLVVGPIMANCFILGCERTRKAAVIDPGAESSKILMKLATLQLSVECILNTHGHFDHVGANKKIREATNAPLMIHAADQPMLSFLRQTAAQFGLSAEDSPQPDKLLQDGDILSVGDIRIQVIHTPGHTPGGVSLYTPDVVFVGDTLFAGSIGRTDFPGGDYDTLIRSIQKRLFPLGDHVTVYCGHGPETTIGRERRFNPFVGEM